MDKSTVRIVIPEPHYTLFNAERAGMPEVISVNDALLTFQHIEIFPWHLVITIEARDLAEQGMPTPEEGKVLFELGDRLEDAIEGYNALFLARSTWNGLRQLLYRVHDPEVAHATLQNLLNAGDHTRPWEYRMHSDPEWTEAGYVFKLFSPSSGPDA